MMKAALIKMFVPILAAGSVNRGVIALVTLKTSSAAAQKIADELAELRDVEAVYITTGQSITLKVALDWILRGREKQLREAPGAHLASRAVRTAPRRSPTRPML